MVYLVTGKAGAGKTTYARRLVQELSISGCRVRHIDGDEWRELHKNKDFSDEGRLMNLLDAAHEAANDEQLGRVVVLSFIAPRREWRNKMRQLWKKSLVVYIPGGTLWQGTMYERPDEKELKMRYTIFNFLI